MVSIRGERTYLVDAQRSIRGVEVGTEGDTCIDGGVDEEGAPLPSVGVVSDGDGAMGAVERRVDVWEPGVWDVIFELAKVPTEAMSMGATRCHGRVLFEKFPGPSVVGDDGGELVIVRG